MNFVYFGVLAICTLTHRLVSSAQTSGKKTSDEFFDTSFYDGFDEMDRQDKIYEKFEEGFDNWEQRCLAVGGQKVLDKWLQEQENLVYCVIKNFNKDKIQTEMESKKRKGELDLLFKKYCDQPVKNVRPCIQSFLDASSRCLRPEEDKIGLNVTMDMIDAAVKFVCHNNGDRLALFMSEDGMSCLTSHQDSIMNCINSTVPELFGEKSKYEKINMIVFNQQNCRKGESVRRCIESELLKCEDPTPSNVINSLLLAAKSVTPCNSITSRLSSASTHVHSASRLAIIFAVIISLGRVL